MGKQTTRPTAWMIPALAGLLLAGTAAAASMSDEFKIKRQGPFEFAEKPVVAREGDTVTIRFKTKAFCDVTVAVEDGSGRILRHLASGVLGDNAPPPFKKGTKEQVLVWDGKDERGRYVTETAADYSRVVLRVSLGLKPRYERHLLWSPYRRMTSVIRWGQGESSLAQIMCAGPEGVYVYDGCMVDHVRLFDHEGRYVRTIYPFPSDKLDALIGVATRKFPQTGRTPRSRTTDRSRLLSAVSSVSALRAGEPRGVRGASNEVPNNTKTQ